jgi:hypothetical protein
MIGNKLCASARGPGIRHEAAIKRHIGRGTVRSEREALCRSRCTEQILQTHNVLRFKSQTKLEFGTTERSRRERKQRDGTALARDDLLRQRELYNSCVNR